MCIITHLELIEDPRTDALLKTLLDCINSRREEAEKPHIAVDGKVFKGCWKDNLYNVLNVICAFDVDNGLVLYQQAAKNKGQEGQITRDIIDILACKDCIVTFYALHC